MDSVLSYLLLPRRELVGTDARKEFEQFIGKKVFLDLRVKVLKNWRNDDRLLQRFGYDVSKRKPGQEANPDKLAAEARAALKEMEGLVGAGDSAVEEGEPAL